MSSMRPIGPLVYCCITKFWLFHVGFYFTKLAAGSIFIRILLSVLKTVQGIGVNSLIFRVVVGELVELFLPVTYAKSIATR